MSLSTEPSQRPGKPFNLELIDATKRFGSFVANDRVSLHVPAGTFHPLIGENGVMSHGEFIHETTPAQADIKKPSVTTWPGIERLAATPTTLIMNH
jgi:hypothetical protein